MPQKSCILNECTYTAKCQGEFIGLNLCWPTGFPRWSFKIVRDFALFFLIKFHLCCQIIPTHEISTALGKSRSIQETSHWLRDTIHIKQNHLILFGDITIVDIHPWVM